MSNLMLSLGYMPFVGIDWTVVAQLLNTLILFLILKKILFVKVKTMIDERQAEVDRIYADAEAAQAQASLLKEHYDQSLAGARDEAQRIVIEARKNAENQAEAILADARTEVTALRERADADKKKAAGEIKDEIPEIAIMIAEKVVEREITPEDHQRLIADFIDRVGEKR